MQIATIFSTCRIQDVLKMLYGVLKTFWVNAKENRKARYRVCIYIHFKLDILDYHALFWLKNYSIQFALKQVSVET